MTVVFTRLSPRLGIAATGLDLRETVDGATIGLPRGALLAHLVLCIRGQDIGPAEFLAFVKQFGTPRERPQIPHVAGFPPVTTITSEDRDTAGDGARLVVGATWHSDDTYMTRPCSLTALHGVVVPAVGGDTEFAGMYDAYDALSDAMKKRLRGLKAVHAMTSGRNDIGRVRAISPEIRAKHPPVEHPVVRTHPETGRAALYISRNRMDHIVGMDRAEGHRLIDELTAHATRPEFVYRHKWQTGDLTIWDNRCLMHKANGDYPEGTRRFMRRIIVEGDAPV